MSAEILEFIRPDEWYIQRSAEWSKRGELAKSLLYAYMTRGDGHDVQMCRASRLYESGNLSQALSLLVSMRNKGELGGDGYALLIKCLNEMTRYKSAEYFLREAVGTGALMLTFGLPEEMTRTVYIRALNEINSLYPDNKFDSDISGVLYILEHSVTGADESLTGEMMFGEHDFTGSETLFRAMGVFYLDKLIPPLAYKLIEACKPLIESGDPPRHDILATLAVALAAIGENKEARAAADMLTSLDLPASDLDLIKTIVALLSLGMNEDSRYFIDELCAVQPTVSVLLVAAEAEIKAEDWESARDRLARCTLVSPGEPLAKMLLGKVNRHNRNVEYGISLPESNMKRLYTRVQKYMFSDTRDPSPEKTIEAIRYLLRNGGDISEQLTDLAAGSEVYEKAFLEYLLDIEGQPHLKQCILYNLMVSGKRRIPLYSYGYRMADVTSVDSIGIEDDTYIRAYLFACSVAEVYCQNPEKLRAKFLGLLPEISIHSNKKISEKECAAVLLVASKAKLICSGLNGSVLYCGENQRMINLFAMSLEDEDVTYDFGEEDEDNEEES